MKICVVRVYECTEDESPFGRADSESSVQMTEFSNSINTLVALGDADVYVVYITKGTTLTPDFKWVQENSDKIHIVSIVDSNKFRRFAPKDLIWESCVSLKHKREVELLAERLNSDSWSPTRTMEDKKLEREAKLADKEAKKLEKVSKKEAKLTKKYEDAVYNLLKLHPNGVDGMEVDVPDGRKKLSLKILLEWK